MENVLAKGIRRRIEGWAEEVEKRNYPNPSRAYELGKRTREMVDACCDYLVGR